MALTNHKSLGKGIELLRQGLCPFVERDVQNDIRSGEMAAHALRCRSTLTCSISTFQTLLWLG